MLQIRWLCAAETRVLSDVGTPLEERKTVRELCAYGHLQLSRTIQKSNANFRSCEKQGVFQKEILCECICWQNPCIVVCLCSSHNDLVLFSCCHICRKNMRKKIRQMEQWNRDHDYMRCELLSFYGSIRSTLFIKNSRFSRVCIQTRQQQQRCRGRMVREWSHARFHQHQPIRAMATCCLGTQSSQPHHQL